MEPRLDSLDVLIPYKQRQTVRPVYWALVCVVGDASPKTCENAAHRLAPGVQEPPLMQCSKSM